MFTRLHAVALLAVALPAAAQDPRPQRTHYTVRNADPVALAEVVGKHFKGEAEVFAAPAGSGNALLISGPPASVAEIVKLLGELDRKPRTVEVEVVIAELPAGKDGEPAPATPPSAETLAKTGMGQRISLTAVEGQPVTTTSGGSKPITSGSAISPGGVRQRSISYHQVGTTVKVTPRIGSDEVIALELSVQETKVRPADGGDDAGAPSIDTNTLSTKLSVPVGKSVVAQMVRTGGKAGGTASVVVVTARVIPTSPGMK